MEKQTFYKLVQKNQRVRKDINEILVLIEPLVATGKKITKREIDKAQVLINSSYGTTDWPSWQGVVESYPNYRVYLVKDEWQKTLKIHATDRHITDGENNYYIPDDERSIYLDNDTTSIDPEGYERYIQDNVTIPSDHEIEREILEYQRLNKEIRALEDSKSLLKYRHMIKESRFDIY